MHSENGQRACEAALKKHRDDNTANNIWPSHNRVIEQMLQRDVELREPFAEIYSQLKGANVERDLYVFFDGLLCVAATWNPEEVAKSREGRRQIKQVNRKIAKAAADLADLLDERERLNQQSGFFSGTHYDVCQVIEDSSVHNGYFERWVKEPLAGLRSQFDMKYWPSLADFIKTIGLDAETPAIHPSNPTTAAATSSSRAGDADFFRAFTCRIHEEGQSFPKLHSLKLSDNALAVLASCALGRTEDDMFDADYVKRWRQRERENADSAVL